MMNLTPEQLRERGHVVFRVMNAWALNDVSEAKSALQDWLRAHPDDPSILDAGEVMSHAEDFARERLEESRSLGLTDAEHEEREQTFRKARRVQDPSETTAVRTALLAWQRRYPADPLTLRYLELLDHEEKTARLIADVLTEESVHAAA